MTIPEEALMPGNRPTAANPRMLGLPHVLNTRPALTAVYRTCSRWLAHERNVLALAIALGIGIIAFAIAIVVSDYRQTRAQAEAGLANLANALENDIARNIDLFDLAIHETQDALLLPGLGDANPELRQAALFSRIATSEYMASILVFDANGDIIADSDHITPRAGNDADRDFFQIPRDRPGPGLFVSAPIVTHSEQPATIVFSRRISRPDGVFAGIVAGSVQLDYFRHLFSKLDLGPGGAVTLFRTDGAIIARLPDKPGQVGRTVAGTEPFRTMLETPSGIMDGTSAVDGVERIYAFRHVGAYPLLLTASSARAHIFASWRQKSTFVLAAISILTLLAVTLFVALYRQLVRRARAERRAISAADQARRSERNLTLAFDRLGVVFHRSADPQYAASPRQDGHFAYDLVNRRVEEISGLRARDMIGRTPEECLPPEASAAVQAKWDSCIAAGEPLSYQMTEDLPIGRRSWETLLVPIHDTDGKVGRIIATTRDTTARTEAEAMLLELNSTLEERAAAAAAAHDAALERASAADRLRVLGQLASGVAHDFNNVLQSVSGCASIIERRADEPHTMRHAASLIADAVDRGSSITKRLLAFARDDIADGRPVAVAPILADVADILRHTLRGTGQLDIGTDIELGDVTIVADVNQLKTVLLNLATNARDAMPDGGRLHLGASPETIVDQPGLTTGDYVRLWVQDSGFGMDAATLARATEPFFTTKPAGQGTGLGLSMARTYAEDCGGTLTIESKPGLGTTVSLWLRC